MVVWGSKLEIFPFFPPAKRKSRKGLEFSWNSIVLRMAKKTGKFHRISSFFFGGSIVSHIYVSFFLLRGCNWVFFSPLAGSSHLPNWSCFEVFLNRFLRKHLSVTISSENLLDDFQWSFEHGDQKLMYFEAEEDDLLMVLGAYLGSFGVRVR